VFVGVLIKLFSTWAYHRWQARKAMKQDAYRRALAQRDRLTLAMMMLQAARNSVIAAIWTGLGLLTLVLSTIMLGLAISLKGTVTVGVAGALVLSFLAATFMVSFGSAHETDARDLSFPATAALSDSDKPILFPDGALDAKEYQLPAPEVATPSS
jgi:hypothetical protein